MSPDSRSGVSQGYSVTSGFAGVDMNVMEAASTVQDNSWADAARRLTILVALLTIVLGLFTTIAWTGFLMFIVLWFVGFV